MPWMKSPVWLARPTRAWRHPLSMNGRRSMGHNWDPWLNEFVAVKHSWGWKIQDEWRFIYFPIENGELFINIWGFRLGSLTNVIILVVTGILGEGIDSSGIHSEHVEYACIFWWVILGLFVLANHHLESTMRILDWILLLFWAQNHFKYISKSKCCIWRFLN